MTDFPRCLSVGNLVPALAEGRLVGVHRGGLHVRWADDTWTVVIDRRGDDYPWGVRLTHLPRGPRAGDPVRHQDGLLRLGAAEVLTAGAPQRRADDRLSARSLFVLDNLRLGLAPMDAAVLASFEDLLAACSDADALAESMSAVLGAGTGLTPFGDDLVVGALASFAASGSRVGRMPGLGELERRTAGLSAWLVLMAMRGRFGPRLERLTRAALAGDPEAVQRALTPLLDLGASSGRAMSLGALLTTDHLSHPHAPRGAA